MFCAPELVFGGTEGVRSRFHVLRSRTRFRLFRGRRVPFSSFALADSFSAIPGASGFVFMFYAPGLAFGGTEGIGSRFQVLRSRTRFGRYRGSRVPFSCFELPGLVFGDTEGVGFRFHVLRSRTRFLRYRGRRVSFSCFALPDSFSAVSRVSGLVFMFCAPGLVFDGTAGDVSRFNVLRSQTRFRWYRGHRVPFSFFALPDSFPAVPRASRPILMICAPRLIFGGTEGVGTYFHYLRSRNRFWRNRGRCVPFSCFALPDSFSAVPRS
jgi:hypothetical protein